MKLFARLALAAAVAAGAAAPASAQIDARLLRYPDVSATQIAFVYAGDIWVVPKAGGVASRLFAARRGDVPALLAGRRRDRLQRQLRRQPRRVRRRRRRAAMPMRVTYHPMPRPLVDWYPDGKRVLFASSRESGRQRFNQLYLVPATGGLPEKLPVPYGEFGAFSADGQTLAYMPQSQDFRTWKRYRGGWASDIWLFDLQTLDAPQPDRRRRQRRPADVARRRRSTSCRTAEPASAATSGRSTRRPAPRGR